MALAPWSYPDERYYYGWSHTPWPVRPTDAELKSMVVERLRENPQTKDSDIKARRVEAP